MLRRDLLPVARRSGRSGRGRGSRSARVRPMSVEKMRRPTSSSGLNSSSAAIAACFARSSLVVAGRRVARLAHRARDVDHEQHARPLAVLGPLVDEPDEHRRARAPRASSGAGSGRRRSRRRSASPIAHRRVAGPEPELQHPLLVRRAACTNSSNCCARLPPGRRSPTARRARRTGCRRRACLPSGRSRRAARAACAAPRPGRGSPSGLPRL